MEAVSFQIHESYLQVPLDQDLRFGAQGMSAMYKICSVLIFSFRFLHMPSFRWRLLHLAVGCLEATSGGMQCSLQSLHPRLHSALWYHRNIICDG